MEITKRDILENVKSYEVRVKPELAEIHEILNVNYWYNLTVREKTDEYRELLLDDESITYDIVVKVEELDKIQKKSDRHVTKATTLSNAVDMSRALKNRMQVPANPQQIEEVKKEVLENNSFEWNIDPKQKVKSNTAVPALQVDMFTFFEKVEVQHRRTADRDDVTTTAYLEDMETALEAYKKCYGTEEALLQLVDLAYKQWLLLQVDAEETRNPKFTKFL